MDLPKLTFKQEHSVMIIGLNDPATLNALGIDMTASLNKALDFAEDEENGIRCIVLKGEGKGFCSGSNLVELSERTSTDRGIVLEHRVNPMMRRMHDLKVPLVVSVRGAAAGVGMSIALMADIIFAGKSAYFLQAFRRIGLVPDGGSTWLLPRLIGLARAKEISLLGEKLPAETALEWGLINRVYGDETVDEEAVKFAHELAAGPTKVLGFTKELYAKSSDNSYEQQLHLERLMQRAAGYTYDHAEGTKAFREKRPAKFEGR